MKTLSPLVLLLSGALQGAEPASPSQPKPLPPPDRDVPIAGAWHHFGTELRYGSDFNFFTKQMEFGMRMRKVTTVLVLFKNGVAFKGFTVDRTLADGIVCEGGFATIDAAKPPAEDPLYARFGKWKETNDGIAVTWTADPATTLVRSGEKLKEGNTTWISLPPVDGLRLEGTFVRQGVIDWSITFRKDGTFAQENVGQTMVGAPSFPERGSGKYEIKKWSLILRFANGFTQSLQFLAGFEENPEPSGVIINGYTFERRGASGVAKPAAISPPPAPVPATVRTRQEKMGAMTLSVPAEWFRQDDPGSGTSLFLTPGATPMQGGRILVFPALPALGTLWAVHKANWKSFCEYQRFTPEEVQHRPDGPGKFILTASILRASPEVAFHGAFYSAPLPGRLAAVIQMNDGSVEDRELAGAVRRMLEGASFEDGSLQAAPASSVVEAYWTPAPDGARRIILRSGGIADFSPFYNEGMAAWPGWSKVAPDLLNGRFGSWKGKGKKLRIRRTEEEGEEEVYVREEGKLRRGAEVWTPLRRVDGLALEGRYRRKGEQKDWREDYWIEFTKEGTFKSGNALLYLLWETCPILPPKNASGSYEIRDWTIFFKLENGAVWSTDFMVLNEEPGTPVIILRGAALTREN